MDMEVSGRPSKQFVATEDSVSIIIIKKTQHSSSCSVARSLSSTSVPLRHLVAAEGTDSSGPAVRGGKAYLRKV